MSQKKFLSLNIQLVPQKIIDEVLSMASQQLMRDAMEMIPLPTGSGKFIVCSSRKAGKSFFYLLWKTERWRMRWRKELEPVKVQFT